ncbi:MAG TPA: hypothetical protein VHV51_01330 [Polyangiaceae bacterium]|nr:hypothetical protein [Polyangiaceae bacterium]
MRLEEGTLLSSVAWQIQDDWLGILARSLVCACVALGGCARHDLRRAEPAASATRLAALSAPHNSPAKAAAAESEESVSCRDAFARLEAEPALSGAVVNGGFARAFLLGRARAEPVVFARAPEFDERRASAEARALRADMATDLHPWQAFERVLTRVKKNPELAREVFLTENYLYTESPELGALYVNFLALGLLFREPEIVLERGRERFSLVRHNGDYEYKEGPERGERATLLLFDRVFLPKSEPGPALARDLRGVAAETFADEVRIDRLSDSGALVALRFGSDWVPAALRRVETRFELECERVPAALGEKIAQARALAKRRARVVDVLSRVVASEVDEALPFDEPKTEEGQQDGQLRPAWRRAYLDGRDRYTFNDDRYWVFDQRGRPHVPEVCIDFVMDTLERSSGAWFRARGERPELVSGKLNFDSFNLDNRRSVETFISFAAAHPEWFELSEAAPEARVAFYDHQAFFADIYAHRDEYRPFDIVTIFGLRSDGKLHSHSFFVFDRDPVTGMPIAVAANAGRPRIRSWENEMQNAPQRAIRAHIRPKLSWLEATVVPEPSISAHEVSGETGSTG